MTADFRAVASATSSDLTGTLSISKPTGTISGDVLIAALASVDAGLSAPSGWTLISSDGALGVWYKVAGGSEPSSYSWGWTNNGAGCVAAAIASFSGADPRAPSAGSVTTASSSSTETGASISAPRGDEMLVMVGLAYEGGNFTLLSSTPPSGMTERADVNARGVEDTSVSRAHVDINTLGLSATGATGDKTATLSDTVYSVAGILLLISPLYWRIRMIS